MNERDREREGEKEKQEDKSFAGLRRFFRTMFYIIGRYSTSGVAFNFFQNASY